MPSSFSMLPRSLAVTRGGLTSQIPDVVLYQVSARAAPSGLAPKARVPGTHRNRRMARISEPETI